MFNTLAQTHATDGYIFFLMRLTLGIWYLNSIKIIFIISFQISCISKSERKAFFFLTRKSVERKSRNQEEEKVIVRRRPDEIITSASYETISNEYSTEF